MSVLWTSRLDCHWEEKCVLPNLSYFVVLLTAALSAAAPAVSEVLGRCDGAKVSGTVTSHASGLPCAHGISLAPSGRFPSSRVRPGAAVLFRPLSKLGHLADFCECVLGCCFCLNVHETLSHPLCCHRCKYVVGMSQILNDILRRPVWLRRKV